MRQAQHHPFFRQFILTLRKHQEAIHFTYRHRLWVGFWQYGWAARFLVFIAMAAGLKFLTVYFRWLSQAKTGDPLAMIAGMGALLQNIASESYHFLFLGGMKYVMVVLLEVVIFHVCRRTIYLLTGRDQSTSLEAFVQAQIRMIKVVIRCYVLEMIFTVMLKGLFNWFDALAFLKPAAIFAVQCYYVGFAVLDNYFEQYEISIKESARLARQYLGVAMGVGLFLQIVLAIPVAGPVAGPVLASVAVTLTMLELSGYTRNPTSMPRMHPDEVV